MVAALSFVEVMAEAADLAVPAGFSIERVAGEPAIQFPMFACFDEEGRLYVAESSGRDLYAGLKALTRDCRVSRLEDLDGDGRFEKSTVFATNVTFPMGLAWHQGRLYLADPPELVALTDTDRDGRADKREIILSSFGHTDNGSLHGLDFGPDGLLYFTMGSPDGWKLPRGDGTFLEGKNGALFRSRPDGSRPEVISRGFENLVEVAFLQSGEIIGTDNWFQKPSGGWRDALVDLAPGGLYPYAPDRGTPLPRTGLTLPAVTLLPAVALSGVVLAGAGLPPEWYGHLLSAEHNSRKVTRHALRREGATFAAESHDFVTGDDPDFHPSDVLEDADGSMLTVDTGGWYVEHCPTGKIRDSRARGGIYRVRWQAAPRFEDPRGSKLEWGRAGEAELAGRLGDIRHVVARRAARELIERRAVAVCATVLRSTGPPAAKIHAVWALAQIDGLRALETLRTALDLPDAAVVCAAARALAMRRDTGAATKLAGLLNSPLSFVRRAAAEALAECGRKEDALPLIRALASAGDAFEEHACAYALLRVADEPLLRQGLGHPHPRVRKAALHLLDQPPFASLRFADLALHLNAADASLAAAARRLLERHPDWAEDAASWLGAELRAARFTTESESAVADLLIAFQSEPKIREIITSTLTNASAEPIAARRLILRALPGFNRKRLDPPWLSALGNALDEAALRDLAIAAITALGREEFDGQLLRLSEDTALGAATRLQAARAIIRRRPELNGTVFELARQVVAEPAAGLERLIAAELLSHARLTPPQVRALLAALAGKVAWAADGLMPALSRAVDADTRPAFAEFLTGKLKNGWSPGSDTLNEVLLAFPRGDVTAAGLRSLWERNQEAKQARLNEFTPLLEGGVPERGRDLFTTATCAVCHRIGDRGGTIGPDLTRIGAIRSGRDLLESILYPSSTFAQGYEPYVATRPDGEEISGSLVERSPDGVVLRDVSGNLIRLRGDGIKSLDRQQLSAMPEGLDQLLSRDQFRDLMAYLKSLK
jgi:putative heme-binding domain-containing protein